MNYFEDIKTVPMILPDEIDDDPGGSGVVDTLGYEYAIIDVILGPAIEANPLTEFTLAEAAALDTGELDTGDDSYAVIATGGATAGQGVDFVWPATTGGVAQNVVRFAVDLKGRRQRYLGVSLKSTAGRNVCAVAHLCRPHTGKPTAASRGVDVLVQV